MGSGRQCRRSAAEIRAGRPVCWQHHDAPRVRFPEAFDVIIPPPPIVPEPTALELKSAAVVAELAWGIREATSQARTSSRLIAQIIAIAASDDGPDERAARLAA